ncbi:hypothetical protein LAG90_04270 [Marinilongibacter aquaticus]|uniref:hypothetical protein n=1 Tax=Marinilongibacter aquaticus TaxID=2975157 RepID=UPI0021BD7BD9|nr:hypothetical protein [Marinilongibacter aquaticus]UBM59863.1 hypothetical protein LAG90_04270 [Marinilongibacter aquaticus]
MIKLFHRFLLSLSIILLSGFVQLGTATYHRHDSFSLSQGLDHAESIASFSTQDNLHLKSSFTFQGKQNEKRRTQDIEEKEDELVSFKKFLEVEDDEVHQVCITQTVGQLLSYAYYSFYAKRQFTHLPSYKSLFIFYQVFRI